MKKTIVLLIAWAGSTFVACTNDLAKDAGPISDAVPETPAVASRIVWSPEVDAAPTIPAQGGESTLKFAVTGSWKASVSEDENKVSWLEVDRFSGEAGNITLVISVEPNTEESRVGSILITTTDGADSKVVTVSQDGVASDNDPVVPDMSSENLLDKISDSEFKKYCRERFAGEDGILTRPEAETIEKIVVNNLNVHSLDGIGEFPNLKVLHCSGFDFSKSSDSQGQPYSADKVDLKELDLSANKKLEYLDCSDNTNLTVLNLSSNQNLVTLVCDDCGLSTLTLPSTDAGSKLKTLLCYGCNLTSLDLNNCASLVTLWCNKNTVKTLNVDACTQLQELHCSSCGLSDLDVSNNPELFSLYCDENLLSSLNVSSNSRLGLLFCGRNKISDLDVSKTNLPACSYPTSLDCSGMQVEQFTLTLGSGWNTRKMKLPENTIIQYE